MLLVLGMALVLWGAERFTEGAVGTALRFRLSTFYVGVQGARSLLASVRLSEAFLGMAVVGMGESLEETARMVTPVRRGHPELAWGNVVGTVVVLRTLNLGIIAMVNPVTADSLVLRFHAPYLVACTIAVAVALLSRRSLGRWAGSALIAA